jgi:guanylate kinase
MSNWGYNTNVTNETIITELQKRELGYTPNETIQAKLATKKLVLLVSPVAIGKSTLMNRIVEVDDRFGRISGLTTRPAREGDEPGMYRYLAHTAPALDGLLHKVTTGELVQYAVHPTTGFVYASELQDYPRQFNCADVLGHAVSGFRALPSAGCSTFSITCSPDEWQKRLNTRYPDPTNLDLKKRLAEAKLNLSWSLQDPETIWIDNSDGQLDTAASTIIRLTASGEKPDHTHQSDLRANAISMLANLEKLTS